MKKYFKTDNIEKLRIENLEFRKSSYLGKEPDFPSWSIDKWYPNEIYKKESEFDKDGDFYISKREFKIRYHKSCFKHKESCYTIAHFIRDNDGYYELSFIGDRPINLNKKELDTFWKLVKYGYSKLNQENND